MANDAVFQVAGNAGGEPEIDQPTSKGPVTRFSVAVTKNYKQKLTTWVKVAVFNDGLRAFAKANIHKGSPVVAEGYMTEDMYNGKKQYNLIAYRLGVVNYGVSTPRAGSQREAAVQEAEEAGPGW